MLSPIRKANLKFKLVGLFKIRMIGFVGAKLVEYTDEKTVIRIPLNRNTRNHLGSVYFGALATGADVAGAWIAFDQLDKLKKNVSIVFKDLNAQFLKRADGNVHLTCLDGVKVKTALLNTIEDGERKNIPLEVVATVPASGSTDHIAKFQMTLSMRYKKPKT